MDKWMLALLLILVTATTKSYHLFKKNETASVDKVIGKYLSSIYSPRAILSTSKRQQLQSRNLLHLYRIRHPTTEYHSRSRYRTQCLLII